MSDQQHGHFGCPECGCREFTVSQDYRDYGSCTATCTFNNQKQSSSPDFDVDDRDHYDTHDSDYDDFGTEMSCSNCNHEFTDPAWYDETPEEAKERVESAERRRNEDLEIEEQERIDRLAKAPYKMLIGELVYAKSVAVVELSYATVIEATPDVYERSIAVDEPGRTVIDCAGCSESFEQLPERTVPVYFAAPHCPSGKEKFLDKRGLPVMLRACLCKDCQKLNVIAPIEAHPSSAA